jgi:hypothetical protein
MNSFDCHKWNAAIFRTPEELDGALTSFNIRGKTIKEIHVIGVANNLQPWSYTQTMRRTLADVGVPYDDIDSGKYAGIDDTLVLCEVEICEPVVFIFEDGSTFEAMPINANGMKMSINQIPTNVINGTNNSNFDADYFFGRIKGSKIDHIQTIERKTTSHGNSSAYEEVRRNITYQFWLRGGEEDVGCYFRQASEGWYKFGLTLQNYFMDIGNKTADISFSKVKKAVNNRRQVLIVEGHDCSSYFWIMPVKHVETTLDNWNGIEEYRQEEISIEEDDISEFLYYFLDKYYDTNYPYGDSRDEYCGSEFEWNLEYNIYTYDAIKKMLDDIEHCAHLLKTDFENEELAELKKRYRVYSFEPDDNIWEKQLSDDEKMQIIKNNIYIATDFYERFVYRMRAMMDNSPEFDLISFMGP